MKKTIFVLFIIVNCIAFIVAAIGVAMTIYSVMAYPRSFASPFIIPFAISCFVYISNNFLYKKRGVALFLAITNIVMSSSPVLFFMGYGLLTFEIIDNLIFVIPVIFSVYHLILLTVVIKLQKDNS